MTFYETAIQQMANFGIFSIFIPFMLIYSLVFLLLESSGLLTKGDNDKTGRKLHSLFAFGFALMAMAHQDLIKWLLFLIPNATVFIIALFLFIVSMALLVKPRDEMPGYIKGFIYLIALLVIIILAAEGIGVGSGPTSSIIETLQGALTDLIGVIIIVVMFFLLIWWIGSPSGNENDSGN